MFKKLAVWLFVVLFIGCAALITRFYTLGLQSQEMMAIGLVSGTLSPCPEKPNCINSEFPEDTGHYTEPMSIDGREWAQIQTLLKTALRKDKGVIKHVSDNYLAAEYQSQTFGFIDDVEFRFDPVTQLLHVRSASRVGYSDLDANKERVMRLKQFINDLR
ncbi:DUF1499 domain-containing protein [Litoribacillus peritrichatus]|uniref:DUF1499 domain-containing protein n=1 Tax=Litoribacillus peritrichatus TaxID=718191 RepID=A0ABP7MLY9_9GAMM